MPILAAALLSAELSKKVDEVFAPYDKSNSPGCAAAIVRGGGIAYERGYGIASLEHDIAITPSTVFDIASVSKQFTAAVTLQLVADGKLSLDDDVRKYVPELPDYGAKITIRNLLHHTSGLRDYTDLLGNFGYNGEDLTGDHEALMLLTRQKALNFAPGTDYSYSNSNFFLLSIIAKRASGKSLRDLMRERIFAPLGMTSSDLADDHARVIHHRATGYDPRGDGEFAVDMSDWESTGDGGVNTSVEDLAKWMTNGQRFIQPLLVHDKLASGETPDYGFGIVDMKRGEHRLIFHDGAWAGYRAAVFMLPDDDLSIAITCNLGSTSGALLAYRVADAILGEVGGQASTPVLDVVEGVYLDRLSGTVIRVTSKDGKILVGGNALRPLGNGRFVAGRGARVVQFRDKAIDVTDGNARMHRFVLAPPADAPSRPRADAPPFAGRYQNAEISAEWTVVARDGKLFMTGDRLGEAELKPVYENAFTMYGMVIEFSKDGFTLSNRGLWRMPFHRV
jgi:CubicO group peptidase (beta-lactamase class C family)